MKLLAGLFAAMLAMLLATYWVFRSSPGVEPCDEHVVAESADGRNLATVTRRTCDGATTTHVAVRRAGTPPAAQGEVFAAAGAVPAKLSWEDGKLLIESPAGRVLREETHWRDVPVRVRLRR